ncbi:hypothetical protein D3C87_1580560 [compost metagenome]
MIVHEDHGRGRQLKGPPHDFPRIDRRVIHGAVHSHLLADQDIALVEIEGTKLLPRRMGQSGAKIGDQGGPRRQDRSPTGLRPHHGQRQGPDAAELRDDGIRKPLAAQGRLIGRGDAGQAPERLDQARGGGPAGG